MRNTAFIACTIMVTACSASNKSAPEINDLKLIAIGGEVAVDFCESDSYEESVQELYAPTSISYMECNYTVKDASLTRGNGNPLTIVSSLQNDSNELEFTDPPFPVTAEVVVEPSLDSPEDYVTVEHRWGDDCDNEETIPGISEGDIISCVVTVDDGVNEPVTSKVSMTVTDQPPTVDE